MSHTVPQQYSTAMCMNLWTRISRCDQTVGHVSMLRIIMIIIIYAMELELAC